MRTSESDMSCIWGEICHVKSDPIDIFLLSQTSNRCDDLVTLPPGVTSVTTRWSSCENVIIDDCSNTYDINDYSSTYAIDCYSGTYAIDYYSGTYAIDCYSGTYDIDDYSGTYAIDYYSSTYDIR